jgi:hypothetical protein
LDFFDFFFAVFFTVFLPAFLPDFFGAFFAFLLFAAGAADRLAFFTSFATAFTGAVFAAAFLTRFTCQLRQYRKHKDYLVVPHCLHPVPSDRMQISHIQLLDHSVCLPCRGEHLPAGSNVLSVTGQ